MGVSIVEMKMSQSGGVAVIAGVGGSSSSSTRLVHVRFCTD